jgi:hypothetical protein
MCQMRRPFPEPAPRHDSTPHPGRAREAGQSVGGAGGEARSRALLDVKPSGSSGPKRPSATSRNDSARTTWKHPARAQSGPSGRVVAAACPRSGTLSAPPLSAHRHRLAGSGHPLIANCPDDNPLPPLPSKTGQWAHSSAELSPFSPLRGEKGGDEGRSDNIQPVNSNCVAAEDV